MKTSKIEDPAGVEAQVSKTAFKGPLNINHHQTIAAKDFFSPDVKL